MKIGKAIKGALAAGAVALALTACGTPDHGIEGQVGQQVEPWERPASEWSAGQECRLSIVVRREPYREQPEGRNRKVVLEYWPQPYDYRNPEIMANWFRGCAQRLEDRNEGWIENLHAAGE